MSFRLASRASFSAPSVTRSRWFPIRSIAAGCAAMVSPSAVKIAAAGPKSRSNRVARSGRASAFPAAFGGCDQDRGAVVGERNTRAQTDEGCANARPKAAQPLKPRSAAMRECARQASDLNGCRVTCVEAQQRRLAGRGRVEDRRACRVGPKDAIGIRAPQPYRRRSERMRRQSRVTENCKLRRRVRHRGVATITANKDLIGLPVMCVHASAGAIQRQAPIALTQAVPGLSGLGRACYGAFVQCNIFYCNAPKMRVQGPYVPSGICSFMRRPADLHQ